ncbi:hypothetical protein K437DRAFT_262588 [Tilletiaria anomala UBC 951]|uniref:Zn(2)-C6 fungal-type domain-containing protein n=1 Tax=Tilletiaria anomala (strain ATCC 24038 / CBS 436.72 / UBC 951) TaxID=1037660 RepID=A0A066W7R2_TILAU|nr:uncharacterized protein K437DRAFT_262588 [Tilletiaria anomala UBC 951]KDN46800.1 hypothetical protein K437DRAFT_262588 [Tilletiaria anomala UBC 951]
MSAGGAPFPTYLHDISDVATGAGSHHSDTGAAGPMPIDPAMSASVPVPTADLAHKGEKRKRIQNVSCDACRFRKVRCDRREVIQAYFARTHHVSSAPVSSFSSALPPPGSLGEEELRRLYHQPVISDVSCTICKAHKTKCTYTPKPGAPTRDGKRLKLLRQWTDSGTAASPLGDATPGAGGGPQLPPDRATLSPARLDRVQPPIDPQLQPKGPEAWHGADASRPPAHSSLSSAPPPAGTTPAARATTSSSTSSDILGVPGLTRTLLDSCCKAYFDWCNPIEPIIKADEFVVRYLAYFSPHADVARILARIGQTPGNSSTSTSTGTGVRNGHGNSKDTGKGKGKGKRARELLEQNRLTRQSGTHDHGELNFSEDVSAQETDQQCDGDSGTAAASSAPPPPSGTRDRIIGSISDLPSGQPLSELLILAVATLGSGMLEPGDKDNTAEVDMQIKFVLQEFLAKRFFELLAEVPLAERLKSEGLDVLEALYVMKATPYEQEDKGVFLTIPPVSCEGVLRVMMQIGLHRRVVREMDAQGQYTWRSQHDDSILSERDVMRRSGSFWAVWLMDVLRNWGRQSVPQLQEAEYDQNLPMWRARCSGDFFASYGYLTSLDDLKRAGVPPPRYERFDALWLEMLLRLGFLVRTASRTLVSERAKSVGCPVHDVERLLAGLNAWSAHLPSILVWETVIAGFQDRASLRRNSACFRMAIKSHQLEVYLHSQVLVLWMTVKALGLSAEARGGHAAAASEKARGERQLEVTFLHTFQRLVVLAQDGSRLGIMRGSTVATAQAIRGAANFALGAVASGSWRLYHALSGQRVSAACLLDAAARLIEALATYDTDRRVMEQVAELRGSYHRVLQQVDGRAAAAAREGREEAMVALPSPSARIGQGVAAPAAEPALQSPPPQNFSNSATTFESVTAASAAANSNGKSMQPLPRVADLQSLSSQLRDDSTADWLTSFLMGLHGGGGSSSAAESVASAESASYALFEAARTPVPGWSTSGSSHPAPNPSLSSVDGSIKFSGDAHGWAIAIWNSVGDADALGSGGVQQ